MAKAKKVQDVWQKTDKIRETSMSFQTQSEALAYGKKMPVDQNTELYTHSPNGNKRRVSSNYESYSISDARESFSEITGKVEYAKDRVALRKRNRIVGYIVPAEDIKLLEEYEDLLDGQEALKRKSEPTISHDEIWK